MKHLIRISPLTLPFFIFISFFPVRNFYFTLYLFIFLHELSHLFIALLLKEKCNTIFLFPWGCMLSLQTFPSKRKSLAIFMAGPFFNLTLALLGIFPKENFTLALFNFLPVMPLDGGVVLNILFPRFSFIFSIFFVILMFIFCLFFNLPCFLPIVLIVIIFTNEKNKFEKNINSRIIRHFSVEKDAKKLYNKIDKL